MKLCLQEEVTEKGYRVRTCALPLELATILGKKIRFSEYIRKYGEFSRWISSL